MALIYKSYHWFSEWENRWFWSNVLTDEETGKAVWVLPNSNTEIGEKNAIQMYLASLRSGKRK